MSDTPDNLLDFEAELAELTPSKPRIVWIDTKPSTPAKKRVAPISQLAALAVGLVLGAFLGGWVVANWHNRENTQHVAIVPPANSLDQKPEPAKNIAVVPATPSKDTNPTDLIGNGKRYDLESLIIAENRRNERFAKFQELGRSYASSSFTTPENSMLRQLRYWQDAERDARVPK